jgi:AraC family transcriptional regulator of adaptative response/methylated-DNA-[protein]-cysteine methyltransferase
MESRMITQAAMDYERIEKAIRFLDGHFLEQPDLRTVARAAHLSEHHFQRVFTRWAGISPKRFLQFLTLDHAKRLLADSQPVLDSAFDAGLSSPGRLHDLFISLEAVTPGEYKTRGAGLQIAYGVHSTPFGRCLAGVTSRGLCWLSFVEDGEGAELSGLRQHWRGATCVHNPTLTAPVVQKIFGALGAVRPAPLSVLVLGTNFQVKVWEALLRIPAGSVTTYGRLGEALGAPTASRAIGAAVGQNAIAYLIPCHRVIRSTGRLGGYRWGEPRKRAMLAWEAAHCA